MKRPVRHQEKQRLSPEMKKKLDNIIDEYSDIFSKDQYDISTPTHPPIEVPTEGPPCISAPYTIPLKFRPWADNTINKLLEAGMIQQTMSTWASPVIIVPKKGLEVPKDPGIPLTVTAKLRLVCDYRKLNKKLPADFWSYDKDGQRIDNHGINAPYPLPCIDEMLASMRGRKFLMTLDCTGAFHGLRLSPDAAKKSAIITHLGKFKWKVAPFRLALLPSYYLKAMQDTLSGLEDFARNYMDDVLIASYTEKEHLDHITQVFEWFCKFKMKLKLAKCEFGRSEIQFLDHIINHEGIRTLPEKTEEISKIKAPRNANEVCVFLGLLNYYCRFIPAFSDLMHPIQKLLKKNVKFEWTEECHNSFKTAKETLMRDPILYHPDPNTPWIIETDASKTAFAGVLLQPHTHDGIKQEVPVTFISLKFHQYSTSLECHRTRTLRNLCGNVQVKLHDERRQSDNKNWPQTVTGNSRNGQIPKFSSSRQILSLHQWHPHRRSTSYNTVQERLLKPHCRQLIKIENRRPLQVRRTTTQCRAISSEREGWDKHDNYLCQISRTGSVDSETAGPTNKGTGHF